MKSKHYTFLILAIFSLSISVSSQTFQWAAQFGSTFNTDGIAIATDTFGNVYTAGNLLGTADFNPATGTFNLTSAGQDVFISKLDAAGNFVWAKKLGGSNIDEVNAITVDETGNYSVTVTNTFNCIANDNIQVNFMQETAQLLPYDTAMFASAFPYTINLSNQYNNYQSSQLSIVNYQLSIETEGSYSLTAIDNKGCIVSDSIKISLKTFELIVPSIIPKNQNFIINNLPANSSLKVFDALGQIVYQSNNYQNNFMPLMANAVYFVELDYVVDNLI